MSFKDDIKSDIHDVFLTDEFAEMHIIDGKDMFASIDEMELLNRQKKSDSTVDGIHKKRIMLFVAGSDFGPLPAANRILVLDHKRYLVKDAHNEDGMYSITLEVAKS